MYLLSSSNLASVQAIRMQSHGHCLCVSMFTCLASYRLCVHVHLFLFVWVFVCMPTYVCMPVCKFACMCVCMHVCTYTCMFVCMCLRMHACMYVCIYACYVCHVALSYYILCVCVEYSTVAYQAALHCPHTVSCGIMLCYVVRSNMPYYVSIIISLSIYLTI